MGVGEEEEKKKVSLGKRSCSWENLQRLLQALGVPGIWRRVGMAAVTAR